MSDNDRAEAGPYALAIPCDMKCSFGAPEPTILQWQYETHLFFYLRGDEGVGSVIFDQCVCSTFVPCGETGHALGDRGWQPYTPLRVINSPWVERMVGTPTDLSHFIFSFHDTTFECIARSFRPDRVWGSMAEAVQGTTSSWV